MTETLIERKHALSARLVGLENEASAVINTIRELREGVQRIDVSSVQPIVPSSRSKRYRLRVDGIGLQYRQATWGKWVRLKTAEAIAAGWKSGQARPWSQSACAEQLGISDGAEISKWVGGRIPGRPIEKKINADIHRMERAGFVPVMS